MPILDIFKRGESSKGRAALSAFKVSLSVLAKAPIPGIEVATEALLAIISKAEDMSEGKRLWRELAERVDRLWYLFSAISAYDNCEMLCAPLLRELENLGKDIDAAMNAGKLKKFLKGSDDVVSLDMHRKSLDSIVVDLTAYLVVFTGRRAEDINTARDEKIQKLYAPAGENGPETQAFGLSLNIRNTLFESIEGGYCVNNNVTAGSQMRVDMSGNQFGTVKGGMFSNNVVVGPELRS
ncbi:hypothetical protein C8J56DRAFT_383660 [Mycena floridula]|nr:hypothetical protein C8J56DRAFT_383660 [Mycena floridula]